MPEPSDGAARAPRKALRYALYGFAALALALGGAVAYLFATFDPRDYAHYIVDLVRDKTGRTLELKGDITLSVWPDVAVRLGALSLSERESSERFAAVEDARLRLELRPLLDRRLVVTDLAVTGAVVRITRDENGRLNIQDLLEGEGAPPQFDFGRIAVERSALTYSDLASGARYEFGEIALETRRLAPGVTTPVSLAFTARGAPDTLDAKLALKGRLTLDFEQKRHALTDARIDLTGRIGAFENVVAQVNGGFAVLALERRLDATGVTLSARGKYGEETLAISLEAQRAAVSAGAASAEALRAAVRAEGPAGTTDLKLAAPSLARDADRVGAADVSLALAIARGAHRVEGNVSSPVEAFIDARTIALAALDADLTLAGPRLPAKGVRAVVRGEARLDVRKEGVAVQLAGNVAESRVKARLTAAGFASPVYTFAVDIDRLDLDRYLRASPPGRDQRRDERTAQQRLLAPLEGLPASGTLSIGTLHAANAQAKNVKLVLE